METLLYNGDVTLHFDEGKHVYTVNGNLVTSVTKILGVINKPALMFWAGNCVADHWKHAIKPGESYDEIQLGRIHEDSKKSFRGKSGDAAAIGTLVHDYAEKVALHFTTGSDYPVPPINAQAQKGVEAFESWLEEHEVQFIESEFKCYSREHNFVGTCDLDCIVDGKRTILDYKTSSGIYPEMHLQTAAYACARIEETGVDYDQRAIILFNKKSGKFKVAYRDMATDYESDLYGFLGCLQVISSLDQLKAA